MLRFSLSLAIAAFIAVGVFAAFGNAVSRPSGQNLKVIAVVIAHAHRHALSVHSSRSNATGPQYRASGGVL